MNLREKNGDLPKLTLQLLGPVRIMEFGRQITGIKRKNLALLAYLAIRADNPVARDTICGLFWPDSADEQARASLRQSLSSIRKACSAGDIIVSHSDAVGLDVDKFITDVTVFLGGAEATKIAELEEASDLYRGDLLEGLGSISPEFDSWIEGERGALRSKFVATLLRLSDSYEAGRRYEEMIAVAQKLISIDPLQEHVHRRLMRAFLSQKRFDAGLKQFDMLRETLANELGVEPERPTLELLRDIQAARRRGGEPSPNGVSVGVNAGTLTSEPPKKLRAPDRPSIGVLRFRGFPEGSEAALLGEGISEEVSIELSREPDLLVVSRQSAFRLDEGKTSAHEIGQQLGIRFYLSGTVRIIGKKLRVTAHLVNCETGHEVWAERFDRELEDYFAIQTEIARIVSATAAGRIAADIFESSGNSTPDDLEGYLLVLRGVSEVHRFSAEGYNNAVAYFEKAIEKAPTSGRAYGWLAQTKLYLRWNIDVSIDLSDIIPLAQRAIELEPNDPKGHCALAMCDFMNRKFDRAEFHFLSALRANPNDELVLTEYGRFLMYVDRAEDGLQKIREAMRINPFHPVWFWAIQGRCLHTLERYDEAIKVFERVSNPPFYIHIYLAGCYAKLGQIKKMEFERKALYKARPDFDLAQFKSIFPYKNPKSTDKLFQSFELAGIN